jgi:prolyl-tRNA synthetase
MSTAAELSPSQRTELESKIKAKGDEIRTLKENGISKSDLAPHVDELKALKSQLDPSSSVSSEKPKKQKQAETNGASSSSSDTEESDYITSRSENYSKWYNDIIRVCDLAELSPVRGCMVIKPWGMSIWDQIHKDLDERIKEHGAENAYFPLLIPKSFLSKEAEHVDGFAKECAVVTHHRLTADTEGGGLIADPEAELEDPLIIRPTSETMIWYMFKKWIVSHR